MPAYSVAITNQTATGQLVKDSNFGANALEAVNVNYDGSNGPTSGFDAAVEALDINHLRYPGGASENVINVTKLENGQLRHEVRAFMEWVKANSTPEDPIQVTMVLPTKTDIPAAEMENFVYLLLEEYGDHVSGLEIGNEYSIGQVDRNADRSTHPEENPDSDFVAAMNETEYGIIANRVINASLDAIERLAVDRPDLGHDPKILIQMSETNGNGSAYKGEAWAFDLGNEAILSWLSPRAKAAIDGAVAHYYYNIDHADDPAFAHSWQEQRSLDYRIENFNMHLGHDVDLVITEWNVLGSNYEQLGASSASILLEMFEFMVQTGVEETFVWPFQHRVGSNIAGNKGAEGLDLTMGGAAFTMMRESLRSEISDETGHVAAMESIWTDSTGSEGKVEVNLYSSVYTDVFYVSLRDLSAGTVDLDVSPFLADVVSVDVRHLTIDTTTSDGLADMAFDDGSGRIGRRFITQEEYDALSALPFFDATDKNHVKMVGGQYTTYFPPIDTILPLVANPQGIEDYYFVTETDVSPLIDVLETNALSTGHVALDLRPYDVAEITIKKIWKQDGDDTSEVLTGGLGRDALIGRGGNDTLRAGEGDDTLKGGYGDDLLDGGSGNDYIVDGDGTDTVFGGDGDDVIVLSTGNKIVDGGNGIDLVQFGFDMADVTVMREGDGFRLAGAGLSALLTGVEYVRFADQTVATDVFNEPDVTYLRGSKASETLTGTIATDVITGGGGRDVLQGGDGFDILTGDRYGLWGTDEASQVFRLFDTIFDRAPRAAGQYHFSTLLASGDLTLAQLADSFMQSEEYMTRYGNTTAPEFVTRLFQNTLDRDPAAAGVAHWSAVLNAGLSRADVVLAISESQEHRNLTLPRQLAFENGRETAGHVDDLYRLFTTLFQREPGAAGFEGFVEAIDSGATLPTLATSFMSSPEYTARFGGTANAEFVTAMFEMTLGRAPAQSGLAAWTAALDGGMTRLDMLLKFINSAESIARSAPSVNSYIRGLGIDDRLTPGEGDSLLSGGQLSDAFVFDLASHGQHRITDFEAWDVLDLTRFGYADTATALSHFRSEGDDLVFEDGGVSIVLEGVDAAALDPECLLI